MSVAIGIPQPDWPGPDGFRAKNIEAGTTMPPMAAIIGRLALRMLESLPARISRLISRPTTKKKIAINPSLIHRIRGLLSFASLKPTETGMFQSAK